MLSRRNVNGFELSRPFDAKNCAKPATKVREDARVQVADEVLYNGEISSSRLFIKIVCMYAWLFSPCALHKIV